MKLKKTRYLALEDAIFDSRIPLRSEEEFRVGITFEAKLVGCGNVPRPNSRMEIVASMRRIRADCRVRKDKKRKTILTVSYEGVKVSLPSGKKSNADLTITQHPIHRIFYVSHDSLDLHIFSYIAREGGIFKCYVFKAAKQSLAVNIVRTIGQAFELCHKMTFIMNECNQNNGGSGATTTAEINEQHNVSNNDYRFDKPQQPSPSLPQSLRNDLSLNMEQMIHDVDCKLDRLSDKIEVLEKQISVLLSSMTIQQKPMTNFINHNNNDKIVNNNSNNSNVAIRLSESDSSNSSSSTSSSSEPTTFYTVKNQNNNNNNKSDNISSTLSSSSSSDTSPEEKDSDSKSNSLNSPDSLLSSPNRDVAVGSCLLFKDLY